MNLRKVFLVIASILVFQHAGFGEVRLPKIVGNGMILQRNTPVTIWGWAVEGEKITVSFHNKTYSALADGNGKWKVALSPEKEGGPYMMNIDASNHITLSDIYFGDVWICSGQSNMVIPMERVKEKYSDDIARADYPQIRQFLIPTTYNFSGPQEDVSSGSWEAATPQSVMKFSAVAYFFARTLYEKYHVPIGLVNTAVGGSPVEAWLSSEALKKFPAYAQEAKKFNNAQYIDSIRNAEKNVAESWYKKLQHNDEGMKYKPTWYDPSTDVATWQTMNIPGYWKDYGVGDVNGVVWFRKDIDLPAAVAGKPAKLFLGRIVDRDSVFVNGQFSGTISYQYPPRRYEVAASILKPGKNTIVVRVINSSGSGGFVPDKPYQLVVDGKTIDLRGEWKYKLGAVADPLPPTTFFQYKSGGLYNAIIAPLTALSIKGVLWYQGESNVTRAAEYETLFTTMIGDWRAKWNQGNFPFIYVQLANFLEAKTTPQESEWAQLRDAQRKTLAVPNTAMVVAIDIGEWNDIHPLNKRDVGTRLALAAQKIAYGESRIVSSGPLYTSHKINGDKVEISFSNTGGGLVARDGKPLTYFSIAGADKQFVWAKAKIEGNKVVVWSDAVKNPVAVRYAWADNPEGANLYNKEGLPAAPFQTE